MFRLAPLVLMSAASCQIAPIPSAPVPNVKASIPDGPRIMPDSAMEQFEVGMTLETVLKSLEVYDFTCGFGVNLMVGSERGTLFSLWFAVNDSRTEARLAWIIEEFDGRQPSMIFLPRERRGQIVNW